MGKYSNPNCTAEGIDETEAGKTKQETTEAEDMAMPAPETFMDYLDILRLHFKEPMHCEIRERTMRVACRIRYLPDGAQDPEDLGTLIRMMAPRHVVMLPTTDDLASGPDMTKQLKYARKANGTNTPEVHHLKLGATFGLELKSLKRRIQFTPELWQKMSFLKTSDGVRVARVRATPMPGPEGMEQKVLELDSLAPTPSDAGDAVGREDETRVPREGALFLGLGREPMSLSSLKERMRGDDWGSEVVDFQPPGPHAARPWSSRVLVADNNVAMGWAANKGGSPVLRVEGVPGEKFFRARAALY